MAMSKKKGTEMNSELSAKPAANEAKKAVRKTAKKAPETVEKTKKVPAKKTAVETSKASTKKTVTETSKTPTAKKPVKASTKKTAVEASKVPAKKPAAKALQAPAAAEQATKVPAKKAVVEASKASTKKTVTETSKTPTAKKPVKASTKKATVEASKVPAKKPTKTALAKAKTKAKTKTVRGTKLDTRVNVTDGEPTATVEDVASVATLDTNEKLGECPAIEEGNSFLNSEEWSWDDKNDPLLVRFGNRIRVWIQGTRKSDVSPETPQGSSAVRRIVLVFMGLLFIALVIFAVYGIWAMASGAGPLFSRGDDTAQGKDDAQASAEDTSLVAFPDLAVLQGLSVDKALAALGPGWYLESDAVSGSNIAVLAYSATGSTPNLSATVPTIELRLGANGGVLSPEFICPMDRLGYPEMAFSDLLGDQDLLVAMLANAGIAGHVSDFSAPPASETTEYELPDDPTSPVIVETWTFAGEATGATSNWWVLTLTYDHTAATAAEGDPFRVLTLAVVPK